MNNEELEALNVQLVAPLDVVDAKNACRNAKSFHEDDIHKGGQVQGCVEFVRIGEGGIKAVRTVELRVEQSIDFEVEQKAKEADCSHSALVVACPMSESQIVHNLLLEDNIEENIDRDLEHSSSREHVHDRRYAKHVRKVKHDEDACKLHNAQKDDKVGYEA